jgi:hypothetical protein
MSARTRTSGAGASGRPALLAAGPAASRGRRLPGLGCTCAAGCCSCSNSSQRLVVVGQQLVEGGRAGGPGVQHVLDLGFQRMRVLAQAHRAGHARAALHGVQGAQQAVGGAVRRRILLPLAQAVADLRQQVGRFFHEDRQQVRIELVDEDRLGGQHLRPERRNCSLIASGSGHRARVRVRLGSGSAPVAALRTSGSSGAGTCASARRTDRRNRPNRSSTADAGSRLRLAVFRPSAPLRPTTGGGQRRIQDAVVGLGEQGVEAAAPAPASASPNGCRPAASQLVAQGVEARQQSGWAGASSPRENTWQHLRTRATYVVEQHRAALALSGAGAPACSVVSSAKARSRSARKPTVAEVPASVCAAFSASPRPRARLRGATRRSRARAARSSSSVSPR